jgi:hypothetical protein
MTEYFTGTRRQLNYFADRLEKLHEQDAYAVIVGDVGQHALYGHFAYEDAEPLPLIRRGEKVAWHESGERSIEVVMPYGVSVSENSLNFAPRYHVSTKHQTIWWNRGPNIVHNAHGAHRVDPVVLEPKTRTVHVGNREVPVRTFAVGTQYYVSRLHLLPGGPPYEERRIREYSDFARKMYEDGAAPAEFSPDAAYEPFRQINHRILPSPWIDLETLQKKPATTNGGGIDSTLAANSPAVETHETREQITVQAPQVPTAVRLALAQTVLNGIAEARTHIATGEDSALGNITALGRLLDRAIDMLQQAAEGSADDTLLAAINALRAAYGSAENAGVSLYAAETELGQYCEQIIHFNNTAP